MDSKMNETKMTNTDSLLETAIKLLQSKKKPKKLKDILKEAMTKKGYSAEEVKEYAPQFILDFMTSGYFVYCGDDTWDLKDRQPIAMLDKDGGDFEDSFDDLDEVKANELKDDDYIYEDKVEENDDSEDEEDEEEDDDDISKEFSGDEDDDENEFDSIEELDEEDIDEEEE